MTHTDWHGQLVTLRDVEPEDWEAFYAFDQDTELARLGYQVPFPGSRDAEKTWAQEKAKRKPDDDNHFLAIVDPEGRIVGSISSHSCDRRHGIFEYGIHIERQSWGRGYASDAMRVLFRYFFDELGYHRVWAEVYAFNERSIALHEKFGFAREGRLREHHYTRGKRHDVLLYGMTADEFRRLHPARPIE